MRAPEIVSPVRVFLLVLVVVFLVECLIMMGLLAAEPFSRSALMPGLLDAAVLVCTLCPVVWMLVVRPLRALVADRGRLLARTLRLQEEERARLARDLHDELGQVQTAVLLGLRAVMGAQSLEDARRLAAEVHESAMAASEAARALARGLSPTVLTDFGLVRAIERVCEDLQVGSGVQIEQRLEAGPTRPDPSIEIAMYRVAQEALTNAVRHASARRIEVELRADGGWLSLRVQDDGRGLPADLEQRARAARGLGIKGMRERVVLLGGRFSLVGGPSGGTTLTASIPLGARGP